MNKKIKYLLTAFIALWCGQAFSQEKTIEETHVNTGETIELSQGINTAQSAFIGVASTIEGASLKTYPDLVTTNTLAGRITGLNVIQQTGNFGSAGSLFYLRGIYQPLIIVDGLERSIADLMPEEIESITVLKDATAKILYGARAANGVINVKTRRGEYGKHSTRVSLEYGMQSPTRMPRFIDSYNYATLYNEALLNDGLPAYYSAADLEGYKNSTGVNDLRYPNIDFYDYFLNKTASYRKVTAEFTGGNNIARYALVGGYTGGNGLERRGDPNVVDRFNIRGSLDVKLTNAISGRIDIAGMLKLNNTGDYTSANLFSWLSSHRPNEYPLLLEGEQIDHAIYGEKVYGGSLLRPANMLSEMEGGGYRIARSLWGQTNVGLDFDLKDLLKGLKARAYITLDTSGFLEKGQNIMDRTYAPMWYKNSDGSDSFSLIMLRDMNEASLNESIRNTENIYNLGCYGGLSYDFSAASGSTFAADLSYSFYKREVTGANQDIKNSNLVLHTNYGYRGRYHIEANVAMMGSAKFQKGERQAFFPAVGLGWTISEEAFLKNSKTVDLLKLRASFGILGYDASTPSYLWEQRWYSNGTTDYVGNPDLGWEKSRELNVGVEVMLLRKRLSMSADFFYEYRYDIIEQVSSKYPQTAGYMLPYENFGEISNRGFEVDIHWQDRAADFLYDIGLGVAFSESRYETYDEVYDPANPHRMRKGTSTDAYVGYKDMGLFREGMNPNDYPNQSSLGEMIKTGDIRYADLNNDGVIDGKDQMQIGNSTPRTLINLSADFRYRGFGLFMLGVANLGFDKMLNNTYYRNFSNNKYSDKAFDRYHPDNNPEGTMPRLTSMNGGNNFNASTFWLEDADFFKLKNVELSYTYTPKGAKPLIENMKFFVRGTNLLTISKIHDLDPENIGAGVSNYPLFTTITGGVAITF